MAQHSSVRPSCAIHRYIHSLAFISGHDWRLHIGRREMTRGVRSTGMRLEPSTLAPVCQA